MASVAPWLVLAVPLICCGAIQVSPQSMECEDLMTATPLSSLPVNWVQAAYTVPAGKIWVFCSGRAGTMQIPDQDRGISTAIEGLSSKRLDVPVATGVVHRYSIGLPPSRLLLSV